MGSGRHRRRRHRPGRGAGCRGAWFLRGAAGQRGLRQGHLVARHQAGARRRALHGARRHRPGARGLARAHHLAGECAARGAAAGLRGAQLPALRCAVLRCGPEDVRRARRPAEPGADGSAVRPRHDAGAAHAAQPGPGGRHQVLGRSVRRCAAGAAAGAHRHRPRRAARQPLRRHLVAARAGQGARTAGARRRNRRKLQRARALRGERGRRVGGRGAQHGPRCRRAAQAARWWRPARACT